MLTFLAMPSPEIHRVQSIGLTVVFMVSVVFVWRTTTHQNERYRRAGLAIVAIAGGPLIGLGLELLAEAAGEVLPADQVYQRWLFGIIGGFAGFIAATFFAASAALAGNGSKPSKLPPDDLL